MPTDHVQCELSSGKDSDVVKPKLKWTFPSSDDSDKTDDDRQLMKKRGKGESQPGKDLDVAKPKLKWTYHFYSDDSDKYETDDH